ncbi:MAG: MarR family winged helix-turn-helix transcriptional regulator [Gammaproteobacteria bacterium]
MSASRTGIHHPPAKKLQDKLGHQVRRLNQKMLSIFAENVSGFDISNVQFAALEAIAALGPTTQKEIAKYIAMEPSNTHSLLRRLRDRDLISIEVDELDSRRNEVDLTRAGWKLLLDVRPFEDQVEPALLAALSETERKQFARLIKKLVET